MERKFGTIIQIGDILVSEDVVTEFFACDLVFVVIYDMTGTIFDFSMFKLRSDAMAIVEKEPAPLGSTVEVEIRGKRVPAEVVKVQFYKR